MDDRIRLRVTDLTWREVDQQVVVLDLRASTFLELNRTGSLLWNALAEEAVTARDLAQLLVGRYGITAEQADADVAAFVVALEESKLLEG